MRPVAAVLAAFFVGLALSGTAALATGDNGTAASTFAAIRRASLAGGVDEAGYRPIGGIEQWVTVRGRHKDAPLLLFLHGGPGFTSTPTSYVETAGWQEYFLVAEWDQRGAGKTLARAPDNQGRLTIERMVDDAEAIAADLRQRYHRKTIVLMGHSWGTVLGVELARRHPDWFSVYVGMGQFVDFQTSERMGFEKTLADAKAAGNAEAVKGLQAIAPYPDPAHPERDLAHIEAERGYLNTYRGEYWTGDGATYAGLANLSPDVTGADLAVRNRGMASSIQALWPAVSRVSFEDDTRFELPIVLIEGRHDRAVSAELAAAWFGRLQAPRKRLVWFEDSAHQMPNEEPGKLLVTLVNEVLPLATDGHTRSP
ncbi:alpha/beta fold hydrolase [Luteibacter sp. NPDC031894]|uniref:alpha/beta fold hydrolase n=1 Tax=Luteibacter sp. NPDC031894 TaxID=3390572 RepID=UPI003D06B8AD